MSDKDKNTEGTDDAGKQPFYEFKGRSFDSKEALDAFIEGVTLSQGSIAQKYGELKTEVEPLRRYNLKGASIDEAAMAKKVAELRDDSNHIEADGLMFEYARQVKSDSDVVREKDRLWSDYVKARKTIFDVLPEEMVKDHIFNNYGDKLSEADNPFSLIDRVLEPHTSKLKPTEAEPASTLGSGNAQKVDPDKTTEPGKEEEGAWDNMLNEFDFKD